MLSVLIIGLDLISKKIIEQFKKFNYDILGYDFDVDKILKFHDENLINNTNKTILNDLLKKANLIILNIDFEQYERIFELSPFIKNDIMIININTYKGNINKIKKILKNKDNCFIPCNFLLFPENIIINYDINSKMSKIQEISSIFKSIRIKTSVLNPNDNDEIMGNLYQIPFLFNKLFFERKGLYFLSKNFDYNFLYNDILLNRNIILKNLNRFLHSILSINDRTVLLNTIINNSNTPEKPKNNLELTNEIILKIIIEKLFINFFINRNSEDYIYLDALNFDYDKYDNIKIKEYLLDENSDLELLLLIIKEKLKNTISALDFGGLTLNKFIKYLNK